METEHRHELERNDLAEFLTHFTDWWVKHGMKTLLIVLAVLVVIYVKRFADARARDAEQRAWVDLNSATSPEQLRAVGQTHFQPAVRALSNLRAGDMTLTLTLEGRPDPADENGKKTPLGDAERAALLDAAEKDYTAVINDPKAAMGLRLNAMLGLGAVHECRGAWDDARTTYQIMREAAADYPVLRATAEARLASLPRIATPVVFGPEPQPPQFDMTEVIEAPQTAPESSVQTPPTPAAEPVTVP